MKNAYQQLAAAAAALVISTAFPAAQAATKAEVAKARSECAMHKHKVKALETKGQKSDELAKAKADWEASCNQAEVLINELNGTKPPQVVPPTSS